jgi:hypothetical protein
VSIFVVSFVFAIAIVIGVCASGDCAASSSSGAASSLRNSNNSNQSNATTTTVPSSSTVPTSTITTTTIQPSAAPPSLAPSDLSVTPSILPSCEYGYVQTWCTEPPLIVPTTASAVSITTFSVPPSSHASSGYQSFVPSSWDGDDYNPPWMSDTPTPTMAESAVSSTTNINTMSRSDAIVAYINSITLSGRIIAGPAAASAATDSTDGICSRCHCECNDQSQQQ